MTPNVPLVLLAAAAAMWGGITAARIGHELQRRGEKVNWFLMRIHMLRWIPRYRELTVAETGHSGPLYRQFVIAMNLALVLAVVAIIWSVLAR